MNYFMTLFILISFTVALVLSNTSITPSEQCAGSSLDDLRERIQVIPCGKTRCKLRRNTNTTVIFKFKSDVEMKTLTNNVYAILEDVPIPFIGVTDTDACAQVTRADTGEPAACPLEANQEYVYTNSFPIEPFYPTLALRVHWSLRDGKKDVICFEVPAYIK